MSESVTLSVETNTETITFEVVTAARGRDGDDASVTNVNVNAAIEDDPEATRDSLGLDDGNGRIPEELLPDIITVDGVTLSDGSAVELPDGTLALDGGNPPKLMIHDGDTPGGVPAEGWILRGVSFLDFGLDSMVSGKIVTLADLILPPQLIPSTVQKLFVSGFVNVNTASVANYNPSSNPSVLLYFVESPGFAGIPRGVSSSLGTNGISDSSVSFIINTDQSFIVTLLSGVSSLVIGDGTSGQVTRRAISSTGLITDSITSFLTNGTLPTRAAPMSAPVTLRCALYFPPDAATANATGIIRAACDLRLHFI